MSVGTDAGGRRLATVRWTALGLVVLVGIWAAYGYARFWVEGVHVARVLAGVVVLAAPPVVMAGAVALLLRRRGRAEAIQLLMVFAQAGWAAFVAGLAFQFTDIAIGRTAGWGLAVLTYTVALGLLLGAWWAEDRIAAR